MAVPSPDDEIKFGTSVPSVHRLFLMKPACLQLVTFCVLIFWGDCLLCSVPFRHQTWFICPVACKWTEKLNLAVAIFSSDTICVLS